MLCSCYIAYNLSLLQHSFFSMNRLVSSACLLLSLFVSAQCSPSAEFEHKDVVNLGSDFSTRVADGKAYFVKLYAPWCGHCKRLAPAWGELAESFAGDSDVVVGHVDCTKEQTVCNDLGIRGYPTLKLFHSSLKEPIPHSGPRDLKSLKGWLQDQKSQLLETMA